MNNIMATGNSYLTVVASCLIDGEMCIYTGLDFAEFVTVKREIWRST